MSLLGKIGIAAAILSLGCSGGEKRTQPEKVLPFTVKLNPVIIDLKESGKEEPVIPPQFGDPQYVTGQIARALNENGIFTRVITEADAGPHDLTLDVTITGEDFGEGRPQVFGSALSTLAWLFAGHASWFVDNRDYPDSDVILGVNISAVADESGAGEAAKQPPRIYPDALPLTGLSLDFLERADMQNWLLNILVPPWWGDGNPEVAGRSLAERSIDHFARNGPDRIGSRFSSFYLKEMGCFLAYDPDGGKYGELVIASEGPINDVVIAPEAASPREVNEDALALSLLKDNEKARMDEDRNWLMRERNVGLATNQQYRFFEIPLQKGEEGVVRVTVRPERKAPSRWTILTTAFPRITSGS